MNIYVFKYIFKAANFISDGQKILLKLAFTELLFSEIK
jgi:hypothetical protein